MLSRWKTWLGIAVSLAAIVYAARGVDWGEVGRAMAGADISDLMAVLVLTPVVNIAIRAVRWRILMLPVIQPRLSGCVGATAIGLMANNVLPARIGEFVRAYALGRMERVPTGTAFGALFVERLLDGFALVGILYALTWVHDFPGWVDVTARVAFYIFAGFLAFQLLLALRPLVLVRLAEWVSRVFLGGRFEQGIERAMTTFVDGFRLLRSPWLVAASLVLAVAQWSAISALYWIGFRAFHLVEQAGWAGAFFTNAVTSLGVAVPSSPGFVGTFEAFIVKSLEVFDVGRNTAFSYAVVFHAASYAGVTLAGLAYFLRAGLSWRDLERSELKLERDLEREFETAIEPELESGKAPRDVG